MGLSLSHFDLGKYIFENKQESEQLEQLLLKQTSAIDSFLLKSRILKTMLEQEVLSARDQWARVRQVRERMLERL